MFGLFGKKNKDKKSRGLEEGQNAAPSAKTAARPEAEDEASAKRGREPSQAGAVAARDEKSAQPAGAKESALASPQAQSVPPADREGNGARAQAAPGGAEDRLAGSESQISSDRGQDDRRDEEAGAKAETGEGRRTQEPAFLGKVDADAQPDGACLGQGSDGARRSKEAGSAEPADPAKTARESLEAEGAQADKQAGPIDSAAPAEKARGAQEGEKPSWAQRLRLGLGKSRDRIGKSLAGFFGGGKIDEDLYEDLETRLIEADIGVDATLKLLQRVRETVSLKGLKDASELKSALKDAILEMVAPLESPFEPPQGRTPCVIMLAGVNGAGKTTSIGKLCKMFQAQGRSVLLAAGDTFRAAAGEQLIVWGERNGVTVVSQRKGDSAAVCFDALESAKAKKIDVMLADTAGRLPTQMHLMAEIQKVKRVLGKSMESAPHETWLVLDAGVGQNAINQTKAFDDALGLTGLILTKLDGTAKGGAIVALANARPIPVRYIGVGEGIDDLQPFKAKEFVDALLGD